MPKRHSLNITIAPKSLQSFDDLPIAPLTDASNKSVKAARRQSSICYKSSPVEPVDSPTSAVLLKSVRRRSALDLPSYKEPLVTSPAKERPPSSLTLVEKHADLLHFIAQKESKCMELRVQLATHEAELAQLKRKWERIVSRRLERERATESSSVDVSPTPGMLEGIKGVSRFITGGLSSATPSTPTSASPSAIHAQLPSLVKSRTRTGVPTPLLLQQSHSTTDSTSSTSTYGTRSTRLSSGSSVSSVDPDEVKEEGESDKERQYFFQENAEESGSSDGSPQVLMVRDTGASPLISPNPVFAQKKERKRLNRLSHPPSEEGESILTSPSPPERPFLSRANTDSGTLRSRRKSSDLTPMSSSFASRDSPSPTVVSPTYSESDTRRQTQRASHPPIASAPGMALSAVMSSVPPISSWMGSVVPKKWEDTISKNQKRASLMLSDVGQSMYQALSAVPATLELVEGTTSPPPAPPIVASPISGSRFGARAAKVKVSPPPTPNPEQRRPSPKSLSDSKGMSDSWNW